MHRILVIGVLFASLLPATVVTGTIQTATGERPSGSCSIQAIEPWSNAAGYRIVGVPVIVPFTAGTFSATLSPTDTATPTGQYYRVTCTAPLQTISGRSVGPFTWGPKRWIVPTSSTPLDIRDVETSTTPTPSLMLLLSQLDTSAYADGNYCVVVTNHVVSLSNTGCPGSGGGSGALSLATLTNGDLASLTDGQLAAMTN